MYVCFPPWGASILPHAAPESNTALHCAISHVLSTYPIRSAPSCFPSDALLALRSCRRAMWGLYFLTLQAFPRQILLPTDRDCWLQLSQRGFAASVRKSQLLLCPSKWFLFLFPMLQMYFLSLHLSSFGHACSSLPSFALASGVSPPSSFCWWCTLDSAWWEGRRKCFSCTASHLRTPKRICHSGSQCPPSLSNLVP